MCCLTTSRPYAGSFVLILAAVLSGFGGQTLAQTEYTADDTPTALEEEIRWLMNRGRHDSASENLLRGTGYTDVPATAGPLAPNESLALASRHHSEDMARQNLFQHATIPGSGYYDAVTQPDPWDRMGAEGYSWNNAAENIAAGYETALAAYVGWWNSTGHRVNMYKASLREVGNGYFYWAGSTYGRYYTMDLGSSGSTHFFTDTVFRDDDGDGAYDQGEGLGGIRVRLRVNGLIQDAFDLTSPVGSFAIPIQSIADGATVEVLLANATTSSVTLQVPRSYSSNAVVSLTVAEETVIGTFTQPVGTQNVGFRNLVPVIDPPAAPALVALRSGASVDIHGPSESGAEYLPQWSSDLISWHDLAPAYVAGTGGRLIWTDPTPITDGALRFYRLLVRRP